jgi:hypothetical protein
MPQWKGALPEESLWALVYYVQSLVALRGTPAAYELRRKLESQPPWTPPAATEGKGTAKDSADNAPKR